MAVLLSDLLESISTAVNNANSALEEVALAQYIERGYERQSEAYKPLTFSLSMRDGNEVRHIPLSALVHNTSMRLETVDVKLKLKIYEQDGKMMADCKPSGADDRVIDEMNLQFRNASPVEGIAKITDNHLKEL